MPNEKTRAMTQGAAMLALFTIFFAIAMYVPLISIIAFLIAPIPIAWYAAKFSRSQAILISVLAFILALIIGGLVGAALSTIFIVTGIVIGDGIYRKKSKLYLFMATGVSVLLTFSILFLVTSKFMNINFVTEGIDLFKASYEESSKYASQQLGQELPAESMEEMFDYIVTTIPATITIGVFVISFVILTITLAFFKRINMQVPQFAPFKDMRLPKAVLWYYLIILAINLFIQPESGSTLSVITINFSIVLWILLTIQGVSLFFYLIDTFKYPAFLKVLTVLISIPLYSFVVLVGILDLGFNVREYITGKNQR